MPWYVVSIHGLCLFTAGNRERERETIITMHEIFQKMSTLRRKCLQQRVVLSLRLIINWQFFSNDMSSVFSQIFSTAASFILMRFSSLFFLFEAQHTIKDSFTIHPGLSGGFCGAIVGLLILLFASWLAMHPRLQTGLCCSWRLQKKLQWLTYLGCFRTQCWRRARCCSLTADMCSFQSRRGWWRSVLLILTPSDIARQESETLGTVTWPSRFPHQRKNTVQAALDGTLGPNRPCKQLQSPSWVVQQSTYLYSTETAK